MAVIKSEKQIAQDIIDYILCGHKEPMLGLRLRNVNMEDERNIHIQPKDVEMSQHMCEAIKARAISFSEDLKKWED